MIITETYEINGIPFIHMYSDSNRYLVREGIEYTDVIDLAELNRVYTEGEVIPLEIIPEDEEVEE